MFGEYKSKKQLRQQIDKLEKENAKLTGMLHTPIPNFVRIERNIHKVMIRVEFNEHVPVELMKEKVGRNMAEELLKFIHWDIIDSNEFPTKMLVGYIYVDFGDK